MDAGPGFVVLALEVHGPGIYSWLDGGLFGVDADFGSS